jgi:hypothetical protein
MEQLPLWFLLLSLLLPRISLLIAYLTGGLETHNLHGWIPSAVAILVPRALVLILIFMDRGFSPWLLAHAIVMACVYAAGGGSRSRSH